MTENKRFVDYFDKDHNYIIQDLWNEDEYQVGFVNCDEDLFLELVNELNDENDILKQKLKTKYIVNKQYEELQKVKEENEQLKQFKNGVFNLINAKIKLYSHKPVSAPISQPMSVNFDADVDRLARLSELEALKKELQE